MGRIFILVSVILALQNCNSLVFSSFLEKISIHKGAFHDAIQSAEDSFVRINGARRTREGRHYTRKSSILASSIADQVSTVEATWADLTVNGEKLTSMTKTSLFFRSLAAGVFTGFGGCLCASVGFDMALWVF